MPNPPKFWSLSICLWGLLLAAGAVASASTVLGFGGPWSWFCDLFSHFRVQYAAGLGVVGSLLWWGQRRRAAVLFGSLALLNVGSLVPCYLPPANVPAVPPGARVVRTMLINVNTHRGNPEKVAAAVREYDPDILVLQELGSRWVRALSWLNDTYPYRAVETREDNFGIGLYSKFPFRTSEVAIVGQAGVPSVFAEVEVLGKSVQVIATHPIPPGNRENSWLRNEQLAQLPQRLRAGLPTLLLGDLNTTPWNHYFQRLVRESGLQDSSRGYWLQPTWPSQAWIFCIPLDHCLHSPDVVLVRRRVGADVGSDHYPLVVEWTLAEERQ